MVSKKEKVQKQYIQYCAQNIYTVHILSGEHSMGVFLDIQAAFDSITPEHINNALHKHGCPEDRVDWYYV